MNSIIVRTGLKKYEEIKANQKLTMTIYPRILYAFWKNREVRTNKKGVP